MIDVLSVNVGVPSLLGQCQGAKVYSAIGKRPSVRRWEVLAGGGRVGCSDEERRVARRLQFRARLQDRRQVRGPKEACRYLRRITWYVQRPSMYHPAWKLFRLQSLVLG